MASSSPCALKFLEDSWRKSVDAAVHRLPLAVPFQPRPAATEVDGVWLLDSASSSSSCFADEANGGLEHLCSPNVAAHSSSSLGASGGYGMYPASRSPAACSASGDNRLDVSSSGTPAADVLSLNVCKHKQRATKALDLPSRNLSEQFVRAPSVVLDLNSLPPSEEPNETSALHQDTESRLQPGVLQEQTDCNFHPDEVIANSLIPNHGSGHSTIKSASRCTVRNRTLTGPTSREHDPAKQSALQLALLKFGDRSTDYIIDPKVGTEFDSIEEAFEYYNLYSWEIGFGIRTGKVRYSDSYKLRHVEKKDRYVLAVELVCCCEGKKRTDVSVSFRVGCAAMIRLHRTPDHGWVITEHRHQHNHPLSETYGEKRQWPSHKHLDKPTRDIVRVLRENNVGTTPIYSILGSFFGSITNVPTTKRTLRTACQVINREAAEDDIKKTLSVFREMREDDPGFLYTVDTDDNGRIKSLMWTNSVSRMQYAYFGDVVTFDTTYRTNLYDMPFGMFVGVNNHFQSVLFACVLLTDETIESFKRVFKEFAAMMDGKLPQTVLTDQARAMEVAIAEVWAAVVHRWCKWHVLKRVKECLGDKYTSNKDFRDEFHFMLNEMLTIDEFEQAWDSLLETCKMRGNNFLKQIYAIRHMWVKSFFKGVFCARQTSTQRSECANHMLKLLVPPGCSINHFVRQYAKLQHTMTDAENYEEKRTKLSSRNMSAGGPLVSHAAKVYTFKVFQLFCKLKSESEDYFPKESTNGDEFVVEHYNISKVKKWSKGVYTVKVSSGSSKFACECGLIEHFGLPCSHTIRVMVTLGVTSIPEDMIMQRWTRRARVQLPEHLAAYGKPNSSLMAHTYRHSALFLAALEFVNLGDSNVETFKAAIEWLTEGKAKLLLLCPEKDGLGLADRLAVADIPPTNMDAASVIDDDAFPLRAPPKKRERGRPTNARDRPAYERCTKRPRFCRSCNGDGHNSDRCPSRDPAAKNTRAPPRCSGCGVIGHNIKQCSSKKQAQAVLEAM